ncbi:hypothetical protein IMSAG192_01685 [Muribaculaceae bacterium]|nr:hypothetical protein IMSAG192_01685 [Muribaculaceae bacterium]
MAIPRSFEKTLQKYTPLTSMNSPATAHGSNTPTGPFESMAPDIISTGATGNPCIPRFQ